MVGRHTDRTKRRTPCTFSLQGRHQHGFVLDLSRSGLFIQTSADPSPGERLDLEVVIQGEVVPMHVEVVRRKKVPPQLLTVAHGGIGVRILSAPEAYYAMLAGIGAGSGRGASPTTPAAAPQTGSAPNFRVRVGQVQGTRTRTLRVYGADEAEARSEAMEDLGDGWKVLEVTRI